MAKMTKKFSVTKAELNVGEMRLYETKKDEVIVSNLLEVLQSFDGATVNISISEDVEVGNSEEELDYEE